MPLRKGMNVYAVVFAVAMGVMVGVIQIPNPSSILLAATTTLAGQYLVSMGRPDNHKEQIYSFSQLIFFKLKGAVLRFIQLATIPVNLVNLANKLR